MTGISRCRSGFGVVALAAMPPRSSQAGWAQNASHGLHHVARAKNVIFRYMDSGPPHVDTFDPKPLHKCFDGIKPGDLFNVEPVRTQRVYGMESKYEPTRIYA